MAVHGGAGNAGGAPSGPAGGDLASTYPNPSVVKLRGRPLAVAAPTDGQVYQYVAANSDWEPATLASGGWPNFGPNTVKQGEIILNSPAAAYGIEIQAEDTAGTIIAQEFVC